MAKMLHKIITKNIFMRPNQVNNHKYKYKTIKKFIQMKIKKLNRQNNNAKMILAKQCHFAKNQLNTKVVNVKKWSIKKMQFD